MKIKRDVSVAILYNNDKFLLQLRDGNAKIKPNCWGFFGGGLEKEETHLEAVYREIKEELEYDLKNPIFLCEQDMSLFENSYDGIKYVYVERYDSSQELVLHEGKDLAWLTIEEIRELSNFSDHDNEIIEIVNKKIK